ncbi:MAG: sigma 54-interacting transcriptional regulator, partial [Halieaceae bacterium]|nr:sigma 54-interacting transcriptional regulator [Halieaceae bacterium]
MSNTTDQTARILVIEDEALVARDIQSRLKQLGHEVLGLAHSPKQALQLAGELQPELLLCDIHLKDEIDGIEVARRITAERDLPVIFLTAYSDRETVARAKSLTPYGYVLKPIETADLQIAIEMALHKFSVEQELHSTRQLLATALQCIGDALVFIDSEHRITAMNEQACRIFGIAEDQAAGLDCEQMLEDRTGARQAASLSWQTLLDTPAVTRLPPFQVKRGDGSQLLVDGVIGPTQASGSNRQPGGVVLILRELAELKDSTDNLPLPGELPADRLSGIFDYPLDHERAFVLLLISPDSPDALLEGLDDESRNALLRELVEQLNLSMRGTDLASYYGGNVFSASLPFTTLEEAGSIGSAILQRLAQHRFLGGSLRLTASIGVSHHRAEVNSESGESPLELFRRAHRALDLARQSGGNRLAVWRPSTDLGLVGNLDSQSELLAADAGQDYRNMALLWNTMSDGSTAEPQSQARALLGRLQRCFDLNRVVLFSWRDGQPRALAAMPECTEGEAQACLQTCPDLDRTIADSEPLQDGQRWWVPVSFGANIGGGGAGLLFLDSGAEGRLRQQDLLLMQSLVTYLGGPGASRGATAPAPVQANGTGGSDLLYQSDVMREVMELIRLVAPTDETVLITGESGTGKEVIASEIHRLSSRSEAPFVIVDCGAVVSTLIERELFGHVRGAFTGATQSAPGKLKEADGGTLLLDEIGELPLDVQVKLLRVVQDKQFTAVGSTQTETVNTRIIAATNVDLEEDIRQGRFREDLYYRLNVFNVHSPPLRQRNGDVEFLADHFLRSCAVQYNRDIRGFSPAAASAIRSYSWPGNVRELRNKLIRAVILCQGTEIDVPELDLPADLAERPAAAEPGPLPSPVPIRAEQDSLVELETSLRNALEEQLAYCLDNHALQPLSQWLEQDLILTALEMHRQVNLQAAAALKIPESTLRRKLARYQTASDSRPAEVQSQWQTVAALLPQWITVAQQEELDPVTHLQNLLLTLIDERARNQAEAAALAGVSPPT